VYLLLDVYISKCIFCLSGIFVFFISIH
jgi:hypothetical protein